MVRAFTELIFAEKWADAIVMDPEVRNPRAIRCYEKCGFRKLKEIEGGQKWLMELRRERRGETLGVENSERVSNARVKPFVNVYAIWRTFVKSFDTFTNALFGHFQPFSNRSEKCTFTNGFERKN